MTANPPEGLPGRIPQDITVRPIDLDSEEFYVGGDRLTEQRAAKLADRLERGGRPSLSGPGRHSPSVTLRLPEQTKGRLDRLARSQGRRRSDVIRAAVDEYLDRHAS